MIRATSIDEGISQFKNAIISNKDAYNFNGFENSLNVIGYHYISNGDLISAIKILMLNTEQFPDSANAYDSLGEAYYLNKQMDSALQHYKKSLELDSKNDNAKKMIEQISKMK
jgi:tetratricopeptide (TPR) repeat protein